MKYIFFITTIMLTSQNIFASEYARKLCDETRNSADQMYSQLPMQIDPMTNLLGMTALYINDECTVMFKYVIDEQMFIDDFISGYYSTSGEKITSAQAIDFLNTDYVRKEVVNYLSSQATDDMINAAKIQNVNLQLIYSMDNGNIRTFSVKIKP